MKKIIIAAAILVSGLAFNNSAEAQVRVNVNIGSQPDWGPSGYDYVNYYYMPDIDAYYSVPDREYIYYNNNRWIHARNLPSRYGNYDPYNSYKVVINDRNPWERNNVYRSRYAQYRGRHDQVIIKNAKVKYKGDNGKHKGWDNDRGNGRGNGRGHDDDHGRGRGKWN